MNPSASSAAVIGNRRLEANRLRPTWTPDRFSARQASSTTSAQANAAVPTTNVAAPIGLPSASLEVRRQQRVHGHEHAARDR